MVLLLLTLADLTNHGLMMTLMLLATKLVAELAPAVSLQQVACRLWQNY